MFVCLFVYISVFISPNNNLFTSFVVLTLAVMSDRRRDKNREETWKSSELKQFVGRKKVDPSPPPKREAHRGPSDPRRTKHDPKGRPLLAAKDSKTVASKSKQTSKQTAEKKVTSSKQAEPPKQKQTNIESINKQAIPQIPEDIVDTGTSIGMQDELEVYDEDFESYDEDFEEASSGVEDTIESGTALKEEQLNLDLIQSAIDKENESFTIDPKPELKKEPPAEPKSLLSGRQFIRFRIPEVKAVVKEQKIKKTQSRLSHLVPLLKLAYQSMSLIDIRPLSEYDIYIKQVGSDLARQIAVQTNEDDFSRATQTDTIFTREKWTQHSIHGGECSSGGANEDTIVSASTSTLPFPEYSSNFLDFFQKTSELMCSVLDENTQNIVRNTSQGDTMPLLKFTHGNPIKLNTSLSIFKDRQIVAVDVSQSLPNSVLIAYTPLDAHSIDPVARKGYLTFWNINDSYQPKRILECEATPVCCCFSPHRLFLAFGGMENGSVCVWDFRDKVDTLTPQPLVDGFATHLPSYTTAMMFTKGSHQAPICSLVTISNPKNVTETGRNASLFDDISMTSLTFQVATTDLQGVINIWVVVEVSCSDMIGSLTDVGMTPGARIKLIRATSISVLTPSKVNPKLNSKISATLLKFHPTHFKHYYIGTEDGMIIHEARHATESVTPHCHMVRGHNSCVTSLDFNPFNSEVFVVGYISGEFAVYNRDIQTPLLMCGGEEIVPLVRVMWSPLHPSILYTLLGNGTMGVWDLTADRHNAISLETPVCENKIIDFNLVPERVSSCPHGEILFCHSDGSCEIHGLECDSSSSEGVTSELESFNTLVKSLENIPYH